MKGNTEQFAEPLASDALQIAGTMVISTRLRSLDGPVSSRWRRARLTVKGGIGRGFGY